MNEKVIAHVVNLDGKPDEFDGRAELWCSLEDRLARLTVEFGRESYDAVVKAFRARAAIELTGDIYRAGGGYELRNPRRVSLADDSA